MVQDGAAAVLARGRLMFVYSEQDTDAYNERSRTTIERMLAQLPETHRARFELRILPEGPLSGFESIPIQERVIDTVVDWAIDCFGTTRSLERKDLQGRAIPAL